MKSRNELLVHDMAARELIADLIYVLKVFCLRVLLN